MKRIEDLKFQIESGCRFCNPPEKERILMETDNFYVMVSLGPIVEGYLLIVTKKHIGACLNIPKFILDEYILLKEKVREILVTTYGCCLFYEHGKIGTSLTMNNSHEHCYHAHLHCIPVSCELNKIVCNEISGHVYHDYNECYKDMNNKKQYLYIEDTKIMTYIPQNPIRRQYLRYKLASILGYNERWDWVDNQNWNLIDQTINKLKPVFK
ncbi:HIT domain-containing protein [Bacteroides fragilis]|uniref:HIT family protein n=1 Tax=Bacteroides fragilis TaxID=817 RepID=UPI00202F21C9|nr:HIT domain-containing protein [Bacteroides fragilis]MCM0301930.1 HIT domain-containing protein [Bacteroides fragilis]